MNTEIEIEEISELVESSLRDISREFLGDLSSELEQSGSLRASAILLGAAIQAGDKDLADEARLHFANAALERADRGRKRLADSANQGLTFGINLLFDFAVRALATA